MTLLKKILMALFLSVAMLGTSQSVLAGEYEASQTLADVIVLGEATVAAMKNNEEAEKVLALLKETKQSAKSVVISGPADLQKQRGNAKIKKSRKAYRAGDLDKAEALAVEGLNYYKAAKAAHFN